MEKDNHSIFGKLVLLLRALAGAAAFTLTFILISSGAKTVFVAISAGALALCVVFNLIIPLIKTKK